MASDEPPDTKKGGHPYADALRLLGNDRKAKLNRLISISVVSFHSSWLPTGPAGKTAGCAGITSVISAARDTRHAAGAVDQTVHGNCCLRRANLEGIGRSLGKLRTADNNRIKSFL